MNDEGESKTNLIINYLPQSMTDEEFTELFTSIGPVNNAKIIRNKSTNYSYGFGFVDYVSADDASRAIASLNGYQIQNKRIKVALARPRSEANKRANLYVKNLPPTFGDEDVRHLFSEYGPIVQCRLLRNADGSSKGVAFVLYELHEQAEDAIQGLHNKVLRNGHPPLDVKFASDNAQKGRQFQSNSGPGPQAYFDGGHKSQGGGGPMGGMPYSGGPYGMPYYPDTGPFSGPGGPMKSHRNAHAGRFNPMNSGSHGMDIFQTASPSYNNAFSPYPSQPGGFRQSHNRNHLDANPNQHNGNRRQSGGGNDVSGGQAGYTLFVYNIGLSCGEEEIQNLFSSYGIITKVNIIKKSNGYAFVTFSNRSQAQDAIQALNGYSFYGNPLQVSFKK